MKKIIYSLVIMIAAGSLFTSCVTNTEPQGVKDLREAKADYLASLSKLREADAEKIKADAAYRQAEIAIVNAQAALAQATAEAAQIANEIQKARNEAEVEALKAQIAATKANAELAAVNAEKALAFAKSDLEKALRKIAAESIGLTVDEKIVIERKVNALNAALDRYHTAFVNVERAKMDIWNMEYDLAAGAEEIDIANQTIDALADYEAMIADAEDIIASDSTEIAVLTESLEVPEKIAGFLAAYEDSVKQLRVDSLLVLQNLRFYEQSVWPDANQAYIDAWNKFYNDSVPAGGNFSFSKEYPLINGKSLDKQFKDFIDFYGLGAFTFPTADGKKFKVSGTNSTTISNQLSTVKAIVEALNRELVILDNLQDSLSIEEQKVKAFKADSTYKADRAILEKGLEAYAPFIAANDTVEMFKDTVKDAKAADSLAKAQLVADSAAIKQAIKDAAKDYIAANKRFAEAVNALQDGFIPATGHYYRNDSMEFIRATVALGEAQAAYFGKQDSIALVSVDAGTYKVPFSELKPEGFVTKAGTGLYAGKVTSLYGGEGYGAYANSSVDVLKDKAYYTPDRSQDPFSKVIAAAANCASPAYTFSWNQHLESKHVDINHWSLYNEESAIAYNMRSDFTPKTDTVAWYKKYFRVGTESSTLVGPTFATLDDDNDAAAAAAAALTAAETAYDAKVAAVNDAKEEYIAIYKKFWHIYNIGTTADDTAAVLKAQIFAWNENTFTKPELCVSFFNGDSIVPNRALFVALDGLAGKDTAFVSKTKDVNNHDHCPIFFGEVNQPVRLAVTPASTGRRTEYGDALYQAQVLEDMGDYNSRKSQLENINTQVAAVETDLNAAIADFNTANAARNAVLARLTGGGAEVDTLNSSYVKLTDGTWNLKGYQKAWADEFAPEYPKLIAEANKQQTTIANKIQRAEDFLDLLEASYVQYRNFVDNKSDASLDAMITRIEAEIAGDLADIDYNKQLIVIYTKAIAEIEQGYDTNSIKLKTLKDKLEKAQTLLAQAEEQLKIAQAEYDEVMAAYGVKNAAE